MTIAAAVEAHDVISAANRRRFAVWSWTPPGPGPFPLLILLHGVYDSGGHGWWLRARAHEQAAAMAAAGELVDPPVILMPTDTGAEFGSAYADWHDRTTFAETFIARELVEWAAGTFPLDGRRWLTGLSMGGYGALLLALRHPELAESATSMSGLFAPQRLFVYGPDMRERIWGPGSAGTDAHDVTRLASRPGAFDRLRVAVDCGLDDPHLEDNRSLHAALSAAGITHGYAEHPGSHDWDYWRAHIGDHLRFHAGLPGPLGVPTATVEAAAP